MPRNVKKNRPNYWAVSLMGERKSYVRVSKMKYFRPEMAVLETFGLSEIIPGMGIFCLGRNKKIRKTVLKNLNL